MSDATIITLAVISGIPATIAAIASAIIGLRNNALARRNEAHIVETKVAMVTLEKQTNSIKDALVKVTGEKAYAEGVKAEADRVAEQGSPSG